MVVLFGLDGQVFGVMLLMKMGIHPPETEDFFQMRFPNLCVVTEIGKFGPVCLLGMLLIQCMYHLEIDDANNTGGMEINRPRITLKYCICWTVSLCELYIPYSFF